MKRKMAAILCLLILVVSSLALAERAVFNTQMQCTGAPTMAISDWVIMEKTVNKIYLRHYLVGQYGGVYTNYFQAELRNPKAPALGSRVVGGTWMAPDTAGYIYSNSFSAGMEYRVKGRGNTNYGLNSIIITGYATSVY